MPGRQVIKWLSHTNKVVPSARIINQMNMNRNKYKYKIVTSYQIRQINNKALCSSSCSI